MSRDRASASLQRSLTILSSAILVAALTMAAAAPVTSAQTTAPAGQLPACAQASVVRDCVLPSWPDDDVAGLPSLFGAITPGEGTWVRDAAGDAGAMGLDILAIGVTEIDIDEPGTVRDASGLLKRGKLKKAVQRGPAMLVRVVLDRPFDDIEAGHSGIHVATDSDGSRSNNAPTAASKADGPFAGLQDVYSLGYARATGKTKLLASDLAKGWYKARDNFAASRPGPAVVDFVVRPKAIGDGLRVVTFVSGDGGGFDSISIGPSAVPVDGRVGLAPVCIEGTIRAEPFTVGRLIESGQTLRDIEAPASWHGGAVFELTDDERSLLTSLIDGIDDDGDGRIGLPATVALFEEGLVVRQRPEVQLAIDGATASMAVQLGLTKRGFTIVRDVQLQPTDDVATDALLERMARSLAIVTPPFRSGKRSGTVYGPGPGSCASALIEAPADMPDDDITSEVDANA